MPALVVVQNNPAVDALTGPVSRRARDRDVDLLDLDLGPRLDFAMVDVDFTEPDILLFHGSVGFLRRAFLHEPLAGRLSWSEDAFRASRWQELFGSAYLGHAGRRMTGSEISDALDGGSPLAVRPEVGLKGFPGGVYDARAWRMLDVEPDFPCFGMPPTEMLSEHRVWFVGGQPVAGSRYRHAGKAAKDGVDVADAMDAAADMAGGTLPLDDVVVDVARTPGGWRIIELNCLHTAGWHAVDPAEVVDALIDGHRNVPGPHA